MRNLKKILTLVLALAMCLSLVSVANATKFSDDADIEYQEAVEVLTALEVIDGVGNNTFNPNGSVTRAQMAKMITIISLGNVDPSAFLGTATDLKDIDGHWAEAYIKYCYSQGIIAGKGNGVFAPDANVTTAEAAKMLLVAIGYNSDVQGYEGSNWKINVIRDAQTSKFFEELSLTSDQAVNRQEAAQMIYNAVDATMIERTSTVDRTDGSISDHYGPYTDGRDLLSETFEVKRWIGTMTGNYYTNAALSTKEGMITVYGKLSTADEKDGNAPAGFYSTLSIDYIGEQVEVLFKDENGGTKNKPDSKDTIYGVYVTGATQVVRATLADVKDQKSTDAKLNIGGTKYDVATSDNAGATVVTVTTNYNTSTGYTTAQVKGTSSANSALTTALKQANGDALKAVTNADSGKIEAIYVTTSKIAAVTAINSEKVSMNNAVGTITIADNEVYDGIAKGDVVVVTTLYADKATDDGAYTIVKKAEVVSGTVNGYKDAESVTLDSTVYKIYNKDNMLRAIPDKTVTTTFNGNNTAIGETFDLYLVNGFVGAAVQTSKSANNYSLVLEVKTGSSTSSAFNALQLQVMNAEGTTSIITVSKDSAKTASGDYNVGDIIVYTGDASDAVVTIKGSITSGSKTYVDNTKAFNGMVTTADCVLFAETTAANVPASGQAAVAGAKYKAYSIRTLDNFTATITSYVTNSDGKVVAVFADLNSTPAGASNTTVYGIVTAANGIVKIDDKYYYQYNVAANEETYTLNMGTNALAKGQLVSFDPVSDNIYSNSGSTPDVAIITSGAVYVKEYSEADKTLTYYTAKTLSDGSYIGVAGTQNTLALDDDCAIVYVDADGDKAGSDMGINAFDSVTGYKNAAIVTKTTSEGTVIVAIYVETSNKCDILAVAAEDALASTTKPQPESAEALDDSMKNDSDYATWEGVPYLVSMGLNQSIGTDGTGKTCVFLTGTVTGINKDTTLTANMKQGLDSYWGQTDGTIQKFEDMLNSKISGTNIEENDTIAFLVVTEGGTNHFMTIEKTADGGAVFMTGRGIGTTQKSYDSEAWYVDISGVTFAN